MRPQESPQSTRKGEVMPAMCEGCKDSIPLRDTYCAECKQEAGEVRNRLAEREAQALEIAGKDRDEVGEDNPIYYAESAPNRFRTLSFFFEEGDGVEIVEDLDNEEEDPKVYYFHEGGREELTDGALYEWALEQFYKD